MGGSEGDILDCRPQVASTVGMGGWEGQMLDRMAHIASVVLPYGLACSTMAGNSLSRDFTGCSGWGLGGRQRALVGDLLLTHYSTI